MPDLNDFSEEQRLVLVAQIQDWQVSLLWVSSLIPPRFNPGPSLYVEPSN